MDTFSKYISKDRNEYFYKLYLYSTNNSDKITPNFLYLDNSLISNIQFLSGADNLDSMFVEYIDSFFEFNLNLFDIKDFSSVLEVYNCTGQLLRQILLNSCELKISTNKDNNFSTFCVVYKQGISSSGQVLRSVSKANNLSSFSNNFEDSIGVYNIERNIYLRDIKINKIIN